MPENQAHGKVWERDLGINVYKAIPAELDTVSYTAAIDVPREINRLEGDVDVSIKVTGKDSIDMADIARIFKEVSSGEKIHMTVILWEQKDPKTKKIKSITEVDLTNSANLLFGKATLAEIEKLVAYVKAIPHYGRTAEHQKTYKRMASDLKKRSGGLISYACKVDSEEQRRVQGRFSKFSKFLKDHRNLVVAESQTGEFRGGKIAEEILSPKRPRNKKPKNDAEKSHWLEIQKKEPLLVLTKAGLPKKNSKDNKEIVKRYPFTPLPAHDSAPHSPPP